MTVGDHVLDRFRSALARGFGLHFDETRAAFLAEVLARRTEARREPPSLYLQGLEGRISEDERRALARELTVGETYFFRNYEQFRALLEVALPARLATRAGVHHLSLLSAGCSSGEEAYSLAMAVGDRLPSPAWTLSVTGVDVNPAALEKARAASYSPWSLRETPRDEFQQHFVIRGRDVTLTPALKRTVRFEERNLAEGNDDLFREGAFDVVFCRNVMMYFTPEQARTLVAKITRSLAPSGYLFLGHAETLRGLSTEYHLCHTHETFYYRRKEEHEIDDVLLEATPSVPSSWVDTVQRAADRIEALSVKSLVNVATIPRKADVGAAFELLAQERFDDALTALEPVPRDADTLLLRAALLTHGGQLDAAEVVCAELLTLDELSAGAHYLLGLCRDNAGDRDRARHHHQVATYLDPQFAMPRLQLGLIARRAGDVEAAKRELGRALVLLRDEDASRLLLFGGGFTRDALVSLCRSELGRLGGTP